MSNFLKRTLSREQKILPKVSDNSKSYKSVNMFMNSNKSESKWNLDEVVDQSCSVIQEFTQLQMSFLKVLESKYKSDKILTDDLFEFTVELLVFQYRKFASTDTMKKVSMFTKNDKNKQKDHEIETLRQVQTVIHKLQMGCLSQMRNFVKLFDEKLIKLLTKKEKNEKKQQLKQFDNLCKVYESKNSPIKKVDIGDQKNKKGYLQQKQNRLKKMEDRKSLGTLNSIDNKSARSNSRNNSTKKGSIQQNGSLFKLLTKKQSGKANKNIQQEEYNYSAIMMGSSTIRKRQKVMTQGMAVQTNPQKQNEQKTKNDAFLFFRPKKGATKNK